MGVGERISSGIDSCSVCKCLLQWFPTILAPGTSFLEDSFSTDQSGRGGIEGMVWGCFRHVTVIVHFISIVITSASSSDHQALNLRG